MSRAKLQRQYVEETTDSFGYKWKNCRANNRKINKSETCIKEYSFGHFNLGILIIKPTGFRSKCFHNTNRYILQKSKDYWRRKLKRYVPCGLTIFEHRCFNMIFARFNQKFVCGVCVCVFVYMFVSVACVCLCVSV